MKCRISGSREVVGRVCRPGAILAVMLLALVPATAQAEANEQAMMDRLEQLEVKAARVDQLESRLRELESNNGDTWLNEKRAEEVKALVKEVLADADTRSSLLNNDLLAGHDGKHFFLSSADGNFLMEIGGQFQMRYIANFRDESGSDSGEAGFQLRRTKIFFEGTVINPRVHYALQLAAARDSQTVSPDKIVIGYDLTDDIYIWAGEDKGPFMREELISSKRQMAVDRSLVNEAFTLDKVQGIGVKWQAHKQVKFAFMLHDGLRSGEAPGDDWVGDEWAGFPTSTSKDFNDDAVDFAVTGRVDVLLAGSWKDWKDFSAKPDQELFAYVGAAIDYEHAESGSSADDDDWLSWTVDAGIEVSGLSVFVAYVGAATQFDEGNTMNPSNYNPWGLVAQASYNFDLGESHGTAEPFVRFEHLDIDNLGGALMPGRSSTVNLVTVGGNWYMVGHNAKLTADVVIALDPLHSQVPGVSDGIGLLHDANGKDNQVSLRIQYQLLF